MSPFIETIKLLDGALQNLSYHQSRFNRTRREILGLRQHPELRQVIPVPDGLEIGCYKCRVLYGKMVDRIEFEPHRPLTVTSLRLVVSDTISYGHKSSDRSALTRLYEQRGSCDDILIIKKGRITDSYFANVALWDGTAWVTPDTPLLPGTMRASLLDNGTLKSQPVLSDDIYKYQNIRLINALNSLDEAADIPLKNVFR